MKILFRKTPIFLLLFIVLSTTTFAQQKIKGSKIVVTENRDLSDFNAIEIGGKLHVILSQSGRQSVTVEADDNIQSAVITKIVDSVLVIHLSKKVIRKKALNVYIAVDEYLQKITTKGRAKVTSSGTFNFDIFAIDAEGDSKITIDVHSEKFTLNNNESASVDLNLTVENADINANKSGKSKISVSAETIEVLTLGSSSTELSGICNDIFVTSEGKSNVKASKLEANDALVNASDASDVYLNVKNEVTISAINSSEIYIYNVPKITIDKFEDKAILRKK